MARSTATVIFCLVVLILGGCATGGGGASYATSEKIGMVSRWQHEFHLPTDYDDHYDTPPYSLYARKIYPASVRAENGHQTLVISDFYKRGDVELNFNEHDRIGKARIIPRQSTQTREFKPIRVLMEFGAREEAGSLATECAKGISVGLYGFSPHVTGYGGSPEDCFFVHFIKRNGAASVVRIPLPSDHPRALGTKVEIVALHGCYLLAVPVDIATSPIQMVRFVYAISQQKVANKVTAVPQKK